LLQEGKRGQAHALFRESLRVKPEHNPEALSNVKALERSEKLVEGEELVNDGKLEEAIQLFREAVATNLKDHPRAYFDLGIALLAAGKSNEAIAAFKNSLLIKEDEAGTHYHLALGLMAEGQRDESLKHAQRALALRPNWTKALELRHSLQQAMPSD